MTHEILVFGAGYAGLAAAVRASHNIRGEVLDPRGSRGPGSRGGQRAE